MYTPLAGRAWKKKGSGHFLWEHSSIPKVSSASAKAVRRIERGNQAEAHGQRMSSVRVAAQKGLTIRVCHWV